MDNRIEEVKKILALATLHPSNAECISIEKATGQICQLFPQPLDSRRRFPFSINEAIYLLEKVRAELDMPIMTHEYQALSGVIEMLKSPTSPQSQPLDDEKLETETITILMNDLPAYEQCQLILALLPSIEEARRQMCQDCTYKQEHNERVLANPRRCIITKKK